MREESPNPASTPMGECPRHGLRGRELGWGGQGVSEAVGVIRCQKCLNGRAGSLTASV
jgi:hypothetical protein